MKEDNTNMEKNTNESGQIKKSFLDFNFSWIMLVIDLALIFGLGISMLCNNTLWQCKAHYILLLLSVFL